MQGSSGADSRLAEQERHSMWQRIKLIVAWIYDQFIYPLIPGKGK